MLRFLALLVLLALHPAPEAIGARRPRPEPCNPDTDILNAFGGAELAPYEGGVQSAPAGVGTIASVRLPVTAGQVTGAVRAHVMVDAYPAATTTLTIPAL